MKLSEYLEANKITAVAFAAKIGRDKSTVTRIANGERRPDPETLQRILEATGGAVTPNDFFDVHKFPDPDRADAQDEPKKGAMATRAVALSKGLSASNGCSLSSKRAAKAAAVSR